MYAMNTSAQWSVPMDHMYASEDTAAGYEGYGNYEYEETGDYYQQDWMYYMDEIETTDTGSYTPSEVETMEAYLDSHGATPTVNGSGTPWRSVGFLGPMVNDSMKSKTTFSAGQFATSPCGPSAATAVPGTEPMKIQLPAEARGLPPLHPSLPAKKMPKFAKEFGGQNRNLDPTLPAKKRLPQEMIAAGARVVVEEEVIPPAAR